MEADVRAPYAAWAAQPVLGLIKGSNSSAVSGADKSGNDLSGKADAKVAAAKLHNSHAANEAKGVAQPALGGSKHAGSGGQDAVEAFDTDGRKGIGEHQTAIRCQCFP